MGNIENTGDSLPNIDDEYDVLPIEIIQHIFSFLPAPNIIQLTGVSRRWRRAVLDLQGLFLIISAMPQFQQKYNKLDKFIKFMKTHETGRRLLALFMGRFKFELTDSKLTALTKIPDLSVEYLDLSECYQLTSFSLDKVAARMTNLKVLVISRSNHVAQGLAGHSHPPKIEHFACFSRMTSLFALKLLDCVYLNAQGFEHLLKMTQLISLSLSHCRYLPNDSLQRIGSAFPNLEIFSFSMLPNFEYTMEFLTRLTNLQSLTCSHVSAEVFQGLSKLTKLQCLHLYAPANSPILTADRETFAQLTQLELFSYEVYKQEDIVYNPEVKMLEHVSVMTNLKVLQIPKVFTGEIEQLTSLVHLQYLNVTGPIVSKDYKGLSKLTNLRAIEIPGRNNPKQLQWLFDAVPSLMYISDEKKEHARREGLKSNYSAIRDGIYMEYYWRPERTRLLKGKKLK